MGCSFTYIRSIIPAAGAFLVGRLGYLYAHLHLVSRFLNGLFADPDSRDLEDSSQRAFVEFQEFQ